MIDINFKENYNEKNINHPLNIIKNIYNIFPKSNYFININNNLLIYLLKNKIFNGASSINFNKEYKNIIFKSNNIFFNLSNDICIKIIKEFLMHLVKNAMQYKYLLNTLNNNKNYFDYNYIG